MKQLFNNIEPADIIAFVIIIGVLILNWKGVNTMLSQAVTLIIGFYFGAKAPRLYGQRDDRPRPRKRKK